VHTATEEHFKYDIDGKALNVYAKVEKWNIQLIKVLGKEDYCSKPNDWLKEGSSGT
jgi:hypothetical protein